VALEDWERVENTRKYVWGGKLLTTWSTGHLEGKRGRKQGLKYFISEGEEGGGNK